MALRRFTRTVDGSIPISALLYDDDERLLASQDNVGIYNGPQKAPNHQSGTTHVTSHRLFYIDDRNESTHSFCFDLSSVSQTEYYAGLFTSSPKVTLHLTPPPSSTERNEEHASDDGHDPVFESWECDVCGNRNPPGRSPNAARICSLCGVPRSTVPIPVPIVKQSQLRNTLESSSSSLPSPTILPSVSKNEEVDEESVACSVCTFLNHPSLQSCEMCSNPLPRSTRPRRSSMKSAPSSRPASPDSDEDPSSSSSASSGFIKLSFRKGGDKAFYEVLKRSLNSAAWEVKQLRRQKLASTVGNEFGRSGISGIMQTVESTAHSTQADMTDALRDLETLRIKAKDMVRLAGELNERLTASISEPASLSLSSSPQSSSQTLVEPEEATFIRSSLSQLGLQMKDAPVTLDVIKDERKWIEELARELARVLQGTEERGVRKPGMMSGSGGPEDQRKRGSKPKGILALDQVWGGWNRARGISLIPPETFLSVIPLLPGFTSPPITLRTFRKSGLAVLVTPAYTHREFRDRLVQRLQRRETDEEGEERQKSCSLVEILRAEEDVPVGLLGEMIDEVEMDSTSDNGSAKGGIVCRDDSGAAIIGGGGVGGVEVRWWLNEFVDYIWDGQPD